MRKMRKGMGILLAAALVFNTLSFGVLTAAASEDSGTELSEHYTEEYVSPDVSGECVSGNDAGTDLIADLPDTVTEGNRVEVDEANVPMPLSTDDVVLSMSNRMVTFTAEDCAGGCQGHTITQTAQAGVLQVATIIVESGIHDITFSGLNLTTAKVGVMPGGTMNLTIDGTNSISAGANSAGIYVPIGATLVITEQSTGSLNVSGNGSGAGIGGAYYVADPTNPSIDRQGNINCGTVIINGGTITANGASCSAGIGGANGDSAAGNGGTVTINGGTVTATGGGDSGYYGGAGIGGGNYNGKSGSGGTLTINGGHVMLSVGTLNDQYGVAYGFGRGRGTNNISAGTLTLADASYLTLMDGTILDPKGTYSINGDPTEDMIVVPENLVYTGSPLDVSGIRIDDSKTGTATYFGQTFKVSASADGWVLQDLGSVVNAGTYTAVFKKGDKTISKTFTVAQSGTEFAGDGVAKAYRDGVESTSFTADDTITVIAKPTATGQAPANAVMMIASDEPTGGQMALFVGDTQVSAPVDADTDGTYTMTASASDVLAAGNVEPNGDAITLTAKFVGNDNMADAAATVAVNITAVAKVESGGDTTYYGSIDSAWAAAKGGTSTVTLLANATASDVLMIGAFNSNEDITFDGGAYTLTSEYPVIFQQQGGRLTIKGGTVEAEGTGVVVNGGTLVVTDGTIESKFEKNPIMPDHGDFEGAIFVSSNSDSVELSGGTFIGTQNAIVRELYSWVESPSFRSLLVSGCAYYRNGTPIPLTDLDDEYTLSGTVTVQECRHEGVKATPNDNNTHTLNCPCCGYTGTAAPHTDTDQNKQCDDCGTALVASVESGGNTTYYSTLQAAVDAAADGTITLLADVEMESAAIINSACTFTLDLNGHNINCTDNNIGAIYSDKNVSMTVKGNGEVQGVRYAVRIYGGNLILEGGAFRGGVEVHDSFNDSTPGNLTVTGAGVNIDSLLIDDSNNVTAALSAGTYGEIMVVNGYLKDLLTNYGQQTGTHYAYYRGDAPVTEGLDSMDDINQMSTIQNVTVRECKHEASKYQQLDSGASHKKTCFACGLTEEEVQHTPGTDNKCEGCQIQLVASVEVGGVTTYYSQFVKAWEATLAAQSATLTLLDDVAAHSQLIVGTGCNIIFDGGEFTLTGQPNNYIFSVNGGKLTITSGTVLANSTSKESVQILSGELVVTDGILGSETNPLGLYVGQNQSATIKLSGGTFHGIQMGTSTDTVSRLLLNYGSTNAAEKHYAYYQGDEPVNLTNLENPARLSGTVTVRECGHEVYQEEGYTHTAGSTKHTQTCAACGAVEEVDCYYEAFGEAATNIKLCACGATLTAALTDADLVYNGKEQQPAGVTFTVDGTVLRDVPCTKCYTDNKNAGMGVLALSDMDGVFGGQYMLYFSIAKSASAVTWNGGDTQTLTYTGQQAAVTADVTLVNNETGSVSYSYAAQDSDAYTSGLPTDAGSYSVKAGFAEQQNYHSAEAELTLTIAPLEITVTPDSGQHKEYGAADPALTYKTAPDLFGNDKLTGALAYEGEAIGTYPITRGTLAAPSDNYTLKLTTGVLFEITKPSLEKADVTVSGAYTYNGAAQIPTEAEVTVKLGDTVISSDQYTISASDNTNAGTAAVTITAAAEGNYFGSASGTFRISPAPLTVTAGDQIIIYGESITQGTGDVTAVGLCGGDSLEGITLTPGTANVPGGTITPSAAGIQNSGGKDVTANYDITYKDGRLTINRAQGTLTAPETPINKTFGDGEFSLNCSTNGDGRISYESSDEDVAAASADGAVRIKGVGETKITATLAEGTNYTGGASREITLIVAKADAPAIMGETRNYTYLIGSDGAVTIDVAGKLPKDCGKTGYTAATADEKGILSGVSMDSEGNLSYTVQGNRDIGNTASITVTADMANYKAATFTVEIALVEKRTVEPQDGVSIHGSSTLIYGQRLSDLAFSSVVFVEQGTDTEVEGTLAWKDASLVPDVRATGAEWIFTPANSAEYMEMTGIVPITVTKAKNAPNMPDSRKNVSNSVTKVGSVSLPEGWEWQEADRGIELEAGKPVTAVAVYAASDKYNFEHTEVTVTITRASGAPVAGDISYTGEGEKVPTAQPQDNGGSRIMTAESPKTGESWWTWWLMAVGASVFTAGISIFFALRKKK